MAPETTSRERARNLAIGNDYPREGDIERIMALPPEVSDLMDIGDCCGCAGIPLEEAEAIVEACQKK